MKRTANRIQQSYMKAKARLEALNSYQEELEREYIAKHFIVNPDGTTPELIYCIEDEATFDKANEEFSAAMVSAGLEDKINAAQADLRAAEDKMIEYGLSIAPAKIREILQKDIKTNACTRFKVIDLVSRLDVSTVRM